MEGTQRERGDHRPIQPGRGTRPRPGPGAEQRHSPGRGPGLQAQRGGKGLYPTGKDRGRRPEPQDRKTVASMVQGQKLRRDRGAILYRDPTHGRGAQEGGRRDPVPVPPHFRRRGAVQVAGH